MAITGNDLLEKSKKKKKGNEAVSGEDLINRLKTYQSTDTTGVDQKYIDSFRQDSNTFLTTADKDYGGVGWGNASSSYESRNSTWQDLSARADAIGAWLYQNRNSPDSEAYKYLSDELSSFRSRGSSIMDTFKSAMDYYSQWQSEDEYNKWYEEDQKRKSMASSAEAQQGWDKYLADLETSEKAKDEESFWEKIGRYLSEGGGVADTTLPMGTTTAAINAVSNDYSYMKPNDNWSDEQKKIFGYLYQTSPSDAYKYATTTNNLNKKVAEEEALKKIAESATSNFWAGAGHTIGAIASAPLALGDYLSDLVNMYTGRPITSDGIVSPFEYSQAVTGGISTHLNDMSGTLNESIPVIGGKGLGDLYGLGTSIAQSMASAYTMGSTGTLISYFGQGAASGVDEALSRGASDGQALLYGTSLGVFEGLAEMIGVDNLFKLGSTSTVKGFIRNIVKQAGAEGMEEGLTAFLSNIADNVIMGDKSNFSFLVAQYMADGMSEDEAQKKAWVTTAGDMVFDTIAGAVSGGVSGGIHTSAQTIASNAYAKNVYGNGADLVTEALDIDANNSFAQKMKAKVDNGKNLSGGQINRLVESNEQTLLAQDTAKMKSAVEARLKELGETGDISELADVIVKTRSGNKLTREESAILTESKYGRRVSTEMNPDMMKTGDYASAWAENIGTERINYDAYNKELLALANETAGVSVAEEKPSVANTSAVTPTNTPTEKETATETKFKVSEDGKARLGDTEVSIKEIASIKNGEVMLRLEDGSEDGSTVKASEVTFGSNEEGLLYENVVEMGLNAVTANAFVNGYDGNISASEYALGFRQAYRYGEMGIPKSEMNAEGFAPRLTASQKDLAYNSGSLDAKYKVTEKQSVKAKIASTSANNTAKDASKGKKKGKLHNTLKPTNETQRASLKTLGVVAEALGIDIYTFESELKNGKRQGANGWYDPKDGSIHIDLYAGDDGKGTMLFTAAHELTHHIREKLPAKFKAFADFLFEQYGEKGISVAERIESRIETLERNGRTKGLTESQIYDIAYEEVVADACESFLADGDAIQKIAELKAKDKTLWQTIKDFLTKLVARIKEAYKGLSPDSYEGRLVAEMLDTAEQLKQMWVEMVVEASEVSDIVEIDADTKSVSPMFSERTWTASEYVTEREKTAKAISKALNVDIKTAYKYIDDINSVARLISDDRVRLDYEPNLDDKATVLKPNSDYKWSVDMSTLCAKRLLFTGTFDAIQRALPNTAFDSEDIVALREMMQKRGYEVACGICYVESTRREIGRITQDFIDRYKESQKTGKPITRINSEGKAVELKKTKDEQATTADKSNDRFYADKDYTPTLADLNTTDIDLVKRDHPLVYEAYLNFMNARGQAKPKLLETRAEYKGEILKHFKYKSAVNARNNAGGLRLQSFSDFEVPHLIDMMQIVMDMSRVGLKSQAYTKVPAFAEVFGNSGVKINLSLIAKGDGLDANGNLVFDDVEGINHKEAFALRDKYSKNVGTILVGKTDAHIIAAMADPRIDYIIPFHKSSWKESLYDALGLTGYADYTDTQHEKPIDKSRKISDYDPSEYWDFTKSGDENAQIYLEKCREDGRIPKFPQFQGYPGYWKLLIDFKMYDNDGIGSPQEVVQPIFDTEASERILREYKGGHKSFPVAKDVVDDFVKEHKGKVKYSDRASYAPTFYSHMGKVIDDIKIAKMGAGGVVSYLKGKGVKNEEIKWSGIEAFLEGKKSVTKEELQEFVAGSQLTIEEEMSGYNKEVYDELDALWKQHMGVSLSETFSDDFDLPLTADNMADVFDDAERDGYDVPTYEMQHRMLNLARNAGNEGRWARYKLGGGTNYRELVFKMPNSSYSNNAMKAHWGEDAEGVLAHARIQDMTTSDGKKMLFVEEIQSDWHNEGAKEGYATKEYEDAVATANKLSDEYDTLGRTWSKYIASSDFDNDSADVRKQKYEKHSADEETARRRKVEAEQNVKHLKEKGAGDTPDAPFRNTYHEYVLKRLIRMAAEEGYDSIGWTTADIQSDRWSDEYAEGYRIEYDQDIPKFLRKYGKKWGAEVGKSGLRGLKVKEYLYDSERDVNFDSINEWKQAVKNLLRIQGLSAREANTTNFVRVGEYIVAYYDGNETDRAKFVTIDNKVWSMDITDSMKNSVLHEGQVLYSDRNNGLTDKDKFYISFLEALNNPDESEAPWQSSSANETESSVEEANPTAVNRAKELHRRIMDGLSAEFRKKAPTFEEWLADTEGGLLSNKTELKLYRTIHDNYEPRLKAPGYIKAREEMKALQNLVLELHDLRKDMSNVKDSDRSTDSVSNRSLLANALESVAQNDIERNKLKEYKGKIALIESEQAKLAETRAKIKELSFAKGERDTEALKKLQFEANQTANRINTYDRQLLNLESTKALKGVLEREKEMAYKRAEQKGREALKAQREKDRERNAKTQRKLLERYQESVQRGREGRKKTEMRYKLKKVVNELNQYLLNGTKEKHVPIELQLPVAEALRAVNMDTVGAEERIAKKREEMRVSAAKGNVDKVNQLAKEIDHIQEMGGNLDAKLSRLQTAYDSIINSDDPLVANSHDDVISNTIAKVIEVVGDTPIRDMSLYQLEAVYDMYRMVLTSIRMANKAFKVAKGEEISTIANGVIAELDEKKRKSPYVSKRKQKLSEFDWNNLKPVYAFERIGSANFTKVFNAVRAGEDVWAKDMSEAQAFREEQFKQYKYDSWDFKKRYGFTSTSGMNFELSLDQILSLYAFSKRDQAGDHLKYGGFVFDGLTEVKEKTKLGTTKTLQLKDATAYNLSEETLAEIIDKLTPEQKAFADAMQDYLSTVMGEKGNEVSLELYDIKLFKEKHYFPLKSAPQYMAKAKEQAQGEVKIKNKGFTKETTPKAKNPIVLSSFMDVWAGHVNEMSMYHAFTLPLEDFYRVYNYHTSADEKMEMMSVGASLENAHGQAAVNYIDQLLKDLNGGAVSDPRETLTKSLMSNFKKAAVMGSLSVVVQQPTAIVRAMALVDAKHFVGKKQTQGKHKEKWEEIKKYAPVAVIKEMGYFDTGMGKGSVEWLKGEKTWKDKVDDVISKAPALADEMTWVAIWNAVKRETLHTHKDLKPNSEEFLKAVGERFTEVIQKTQVYDSTLARSANMRSKSAFMSMLTSFMAEPTTSINMLQDAFRKFKGNKKYFARTLGAVYGSVVLNSALVSLVYAMRDDDEDETYLEKYVSRFVTEVVDGVNPLTYIPGVKDIWSAAQGFDIERADMSLITNVLDSFQQVVKVASKDTSDMDEEKLSEHRKAVAEAWLSVGDDITALVGVPVKNFRRDINGIINTFKTFGRDQETTAGSLADNIGEDLKDSIPVWGWFPDKSKGDKLYDAIKDGDTDYVERMKEYAEIEHFYTALVEEGPIMAQAVKAVIIGTKVDEGKTIEEAEESFVNSVASYVKKRYEEGDISYNEAMDILINFCGKSAEEAEIKVQYWEYKQENPDADVEESWFKKYNEDVSSSGISIDMYVNYRTKIKGIEADKDNNGNTISGSRKAKVMAVINSLPISSAQKDALYFAEGWTASRLWEAPWH